MPSFEIQYTAAQGQKLVIEYQADYDANAEARVKASLPAITIAEYIRLEIINLIKGKYKEKKRRRLLNAVDAPDDLELT